MATDDEMESESSSNSRLNSSTRSASAQNYPQSGDNAVTRSLSSKPHAAFRSATAVDFKRHKLHAHSQATGLSIHGNHMVYSSFFLNHQRAKSALAASHVNINRGSKHATPLSSYKSEEDERPKKSFWTLLRIGMVYFGIEMIFSLEVALAIPLLLKLKVSEE
jgi:hypothetical protein